MARCRLTLYAAAATALGTAAILTTYFVLAAQQQRVSSAQTLAPRSPSASPTMRLAPTTRAPSGSPSSTP